MKGRKRKGKERGRIASWLLGAWTTLTLNKFFNKFPEHYISGKFLPEMSKLTTLTVTLFLTGILTATRILTLAE